MPDNRKKRGPIDRAWISLKEPFEVRYWSKKYKVAPAKLRRAVKDAGRSAKKVGAYIDLQRHRASDRVRVSLKEAYEVRYWSKKFKVTPVLLKAAVKAAGRSSKQVGAWISTSKKTRRKPARRKAAKRKKRS